MHTTTPPPVAGILLAGGRSRRMGGTDKAFARLGNKPLIEHVISRAAPQVSPLLLSITGKVDAYRRYQLTAVPDQLSGFGGPLVGVLSAMRWMRQNDPASGWLASFATDTPFIPTDTVAKLHAAAERDATLIACPRSNGRAHPVCALWSLRLLPHLESFLIEHNQHKVQTFLRQFTVSWVDFKQTDIDPFFNINTPDDLITAAKSGQPDAADR